MKKSVVVILLLASVAMAQSKPLIKPDAAWQKDYAMYMKRTTALQKKHAKQVAQDQHEMDYLAGVAQRLGQAIPQGYTVDAETYWFIPIPAPAPASEENKDAAPKK